MIITYSMIKHVMDQLSKGSDLAIEYAAGGGITIRIKTNGKEIQKAFSPRELPKYQCGVTDAGESIRFFNIVCKDLIQKLR